MLLENFLFRKFQRVINLILQSGSVLRDDVGSSFCNAVLRTKNEGLSINAEEATIFFSNSSTSHWINIIWKYIFSKLYKFQSGQLLKYFQES